MIRADDIFSLDCFLYSEYIGFSYPKRLGSAGYCLYHLPCFFRHTLPSAWDALISAAVVTKFIFLFPKRIVLTGYTFKAS